jgi:hypothetical protein
MGVTILWAAAAALVPAMQKGNEAARVGHIALNSINVALFAWQVYTGLDIMVKVWGFTSWFVLKSRFFLFLSFFSGRKHSVKIVYCIFK